MRSLLLLLLLGATPAAAAVWQPGMQEVPLAPMSASLGGGQAVAAEAEGRMLVLFQVNVNDTTFHVGCVERDATGTWGAWSPVSGEGRNARNPSVAMGADGRAHIVWEDITDGEGDIRYCVREPGGTLSAPVAISDAPGASREPVVAVDAFGNIHVVWVDARTGPPLVYHAGLPPGGDWGAPRILSPVGESPDQPAIAADGAGGIHVAWRERVGSARTGVSYDIFYLRTALSEPLGAPVRLINHIAMSQWPSLACTVDGVVHLVWVDNRDAQQGSYFEVYYKRYLPGIGWGHDKRFTRDNADHSRPVVAAGAGSTVNVAWEDFRYGNSEVFFRQITPEYGWDPVSSRLSSDISSSQSPALALMPDGTMLAVWTDARGFGEFRVLTRTGLLTGSP